MDSEKIGEKFGFVLMFVVSTTILFFVLTILDKIGDWNYLNIFILVLIITLIGAFIKRILK